MLYLDGPLHAFNQWLSAGNVLAVQVTGFVTGFNNSEEKKNDSVPLPAGERERERDRDRDREREKRGLKGWK